MLVRGSGQTLAEPEFNSNMAVESLINPIDRAESSDDAVVRQIQELLDEPVASGSGGSVPKQKSRTGMRAGVAKSSRSSSRIGDSSVYTYDELIEHRPKRYDSDNDEFRFNIEDVERKF